MKTKLASIALVASAACCAFAKCYTRSSMPQIKCDQFGQAAAVAAAVATAMASLGNQIRMQTFVKGQSSQSVNLSISQSVNQTSMHYAGPN